MTVCDLNARAVFMTACRPWICSPVKMWWEQRQPSERPQLAMPENSHRTENHLISLTSKREHDNCCVPFPQSSNHLTQYVCFQITCRPPTTTLPQEAIMKWEIYVGNVQLCAVSINTSVVVSGTGASRLNSSISLSALQTGSGSEGCILLEKAGRHFTMGITFKTRRVRKRLNASAVEMNGPFQNVWP